MYFLKHIKKIFANILGSKKFFYMFCSNQKGENMNITRIGMNATTFGIDPRPTYKSDLEIQDLPEIKRATSSTKINTDEVEDLFITRRTQPIQHTEYIFKKDRLSRNTKTPFQTNGFIFNGKTDFILSKEAQKTQLIKDIKAQENLTSFEITDNKRLGKGVSYKLIGEPLSTANSSLIEVKKFDLNFKKEKKDFKEMEVIKIEAPFKDFAIAMIRNTDKIGKFTMTIENK